MTAPIRCGGLTLDELAAIQARPRLALGCGKIAICTHRMRRTRETKTSARKVGWMSASSSLTAEAATDGR